MVGISAPRVDTERPPLKDSQNTAKNIHKEGGMLSDESTAEIEQSKSVTLQNLWDVRHHADIATWKFILLMPFLCAIAKRSLENDIDRERELRREARRQVRIEELKEEIKNEER